MPRSSVSENSLVFSEAGLVELRIQPRIPDCTLMLVPLVCMSTIWGRSKMRKLEGVWTWKVAEWAGGSDREEKRHLLGNSKSYMLLMGQGTMQPRS